jgi:hypothetical protein
MSCLDVLFQHSYGELGKPGQSTTVLLQQHAQLAVFEDLLNHMCYIFSNLDTKDFTMYNAVATGPGNMEEAHYF